MLLRWVTETEEDIFRCIFWIPSLILEEAVLVKDTFYIQKSTDTSIHWFVWLKMVTSEQVLQAKIKDKDFGLKKKKE